MPVRSVSSIAGDDRPRTMDDGWLSMVNGLLSIVRYKFHDIAGGEEEGRFAGWVEEFEWRVTDDMPAAGGVDGVDSGLGTGDGDGTSRHTSPRRGHAGQGQFFVENAKVGKAGGESHHVDGVLTLAV